MVRENALFADARHNGHDYSQRRRPLARLEKKQWSTVIFQEDYLAQIRDYILNNPARWTQDRLMQEDYKRHEIRRSRLKNEE